MLNQKLAVESSQKIHANCLITSAIQNFCTSRLSNDLSTTGGIVMNKKILTLAVLSLLASSSAWAQSSLTLYGNIDGSVVSASGIGAGKDRRTSFGEGNWAPSVWGVQGTEDLGGGMRAIFQLEGGYNAGTGAIANGGTTGVFSRLANVGISGSFGTVKAGLNLSPFIDAYTSVLGLAGNNFYVPALQMHRAGTVLNSANVSVPAYTGGTDADPGFATTGGFFIPNSVAYSLPSEVVGGLRGNVLYSFGGVAGSFSRNRFMSANAGYAFGELNVVAAISDRDEQYRQWLVGASIPVGSVKLAANYVRFHPETGDSSQTYVLGAETQLIPSTRIGINYAHNSGPGNPSIINLSTVYSLSKSTHLYAAFNRATDGIPSSYSGSDATLTQPGTSNAVIVGLQKSF
jgi:predicted porin